MKIFLVLLVVLVLNQSIAKADSLKCYNCEGDACDSLTNDQLIACEESDESSTAKPTTTPITPSGSTPSVPIPSDSTPSDSTPSESTPSDSTPSDSTPSDSTPSDSTPSDSTPSEFTPSVSTPSDSTPSESSPSDSTPSETALITSTDATPASPIEIRAESRSLNALSAAAKLIRNYRSIQRTGRAEDLYACYIIKVTDGTSGNQKRGCVKYAPGDKVCAVLESQEADKITSCFTCQNDGCNGSGILHVSAALILASLTFKYFL